ncbi:MAG: cellulase family glycosylhydrolase [Monoglobaceae bacterium]
MKRFLAFLMCICFILLNFTAYATENNELSMRLVCLGADVGNTVFEGAPEIKMDIKNPTNENVNISGTYTITDSAGAVVESGSIDGFSVNAKTATVKNLPIQLTRYGNFTVSASVNGKTAQTRFSIIHPGGDNSNLGVQTHFAFKTREQPEEASKHIAEAGFGVIRDELYWVNGDSGDLSNPTYSIPDYTQKTLQYAKANGLKVLLNINYVHVGYDYGKFPTSTFAIDRYAKYCAYVVNELEKMGYGDTVLAYEIWNEPNLKANGFVNTSGTPAADGDTRNITAAEYKNLLKAAYAKIKEADQNAIVVGGSLTSQYYDDYDNDLVYDPEDGQTGFDFMSDLLEGWSNNDRFMDAISLHPYTYRLTYPDETPAGTFLEQIAQAKDIINNAGADLPIWVSEFGFSSYADASNSISERMQATGIARAVVQSRSRECIGLMSIYNYREKGEGNGKEENYGIVDGSLYPKDAYGALAFYNSLLGGAEYKECYENQCSVYRFTDEEYLKDIFAVWSKTGANSTLNVSSGQSVTYTANDTGLSVTLPENYELVIYDMFGNKIENAGTYTVGEEVVYAVIRPKNGSIICKDGKVTVIGSGKPMDKVTLLVKDAKTDFNIIKHIGQTTSDSNGDFKFEFPIENYDMYSVYVYNSNLYNDTLSTSPKIGNLKYTLYNSDTNELIDSEEDLLAADKIRIETDTSDTADSLVMFASVFSADGEVAAASSSHIADGKASVILELPENWVDIKFMLWNNDNLSPVINKTEYSR